jgi:hypothetical protein
VSTSSANSSVGDLRAAAARLLKRDVVSLERFAGGRNSQVYRLDCNGDRGAETYVVKQYYSVPGDTRDRLHTEFRALQFMKANGIDNVPAPIAVDAGTQSAIYERAEGEPATGQPIAAADIGAAADFLLRLHALGGAAGAGSMSAASEACFSIDATFANLGRRLGRLRAVSGDAPGARSLRAWLDTRFDPMLASLEIWADEEAQRADIRRDADIPPAERTLSPSDFGFHNALRAPGGRLTFVDFEYFGWDDPAKMIADFLLHPAMDLEPALKRQFARAILQGMSAQERLAARARIVYPLFGLKWCLILLNEFVPDDLRRRLFAALGETGGADLLRQQLNRAERLLDRIGAEYRSNPYLD